MNSYTRNYLSEIRKREQAAFEKTKNTALNQTENVEVIKNTLQLLSDKGTLFQSLTKHECIRIRSDFDEQASPQDYLSICGLFESFKRRLNVFASQTSANKKEFADAAFILPESQKKIPHKELTIELMEFADLCQQHGIKISDELQEKIDALRKKQQTSMAK